MTDVLTHGGAAGTLCPHSRGAKNQPIYAKIIQKSDEANEWLMQPLLESLSSTPPPLPFVFYFILNCNIKLRRSARFFYQCKSDSLFVKKVRLGKENVNLLRKKNKKH